VYSYFLIFSHYKKAVGAILVYDVTKKTSFDNISNWLKDLKNFSGSSCVGILVGNKVDVVEKNHKRREVTYEEAKIFAAENDLLFKETSALTNQNVVEVFHEMIESKEISLSSFLF
jgi:GTPase SAR1 family protein